MKKGPKPRTLSERFAGKYRIVESGCWEWTRGLNRKGYGNILNEAGADGPRLIGAHVASYLVHWGPVPEGATVDHLCNNPRCVNPSHLRLASYRENNNRGSSPTAINSRKTRCINGHPFDSKNTHWRPTGGRACRRCAADRTRARRERLRAA